MLTALLCTRDLGGTVASVISVTTNVGSRLFGPQCILLFPNILRCMKSGASLRPWSLCHS